MASDRLPARRTGRHGNCSTEPGMKGLAYVQARYPNVLRWVALAIVLVLAACNNSTDSGGGGGGY